MIEYENYENENDCTYVQKKCISNWEGKWNTLKENLNRSHPQECHQQQQQLPEDLNCNKAKVITDDWFNSENYLKWHLKPDLIKWYILTSFNYPIKNYFADFVRPSRSWRRRYLMQRPDMLQWQWQLSWWWELAVTVGGHRRRGFMKGVYRKFYPVNSFKICFANNPK